jgi:hypothetical protein
MTGISVRVAHIWADLVEKTNEAFGADGKSDDPLFQYLRTSRHENVTQEIK